MRAQKLQPGISRKWQVKCKLPKFTSCDTSTLSSHTVNTRRGNPRPNQGLCKTKTQIKGKQATTRRPLTPEVHTSRKIDVANVEIPRTWKVLLALQINVRDVINVATSPACVYEKSAETSLPQAPQTRGTSADHWNNSNI